MEFHELTGKRKVTKAKAYESGRNESPTGVYIYTSWQESH